MCLQKPSSTLIARVGQKYFFFSFLYFCNCPEKSLYVHGAKPKHCSNFHSGSNGPRGARSSQQCKKVVCLTVLATTVGTVCSTACGLCKEPCTLRVCMYFYALFYSVAISLAQVGDPALCTQLSDDLIKKYGHYVQAINYPTVARGEEKLRLAPTPHHSREMMDGFADDLAACWIEAGLPLSKGNMDKCAQHKTCAYCHKPFLFERLQARVREESCHEVNCPQAVATF